MGRRNTQSRDLAALKLKRDGRTYDQIADELHFSNRSSAWKAVQRAIKFTDVAATRDEHKAVELARLDRQHDLIQKAIDRGEVELLAGVNAQLQISKQRSRLLELYTSVNANRPRTSVEDDDAVGGAKVIDMQEAAAAIREAMSGRSS